MSVITFRLNSIELKDSTLHEINNNLIRINLTQRPTHKTEDFLLKNSSYLHNINHEFFIQDSLDKVNRLTLTVRSVLRKTTLASIFNIGNESNKVNKKSDHSVDNYIQGCKQNQDGVIDCEYIEPKHSLIGYCTINLKELERGVNNTLRVELLTRVNVKVVGYANLEVYTWVDPDMVSARQKLQPKSKEPILFIDPGCPQQQNLVF